MRSARFRIGAVALGALLLTGCDDWGDWGGNFDRHKEEFRFTKTLKPGGRVSLENLNGAVEVTTHDGDTVEISGTKYASSPELLRALEIDVVEGADSVRIRTVQPSGHRGGMGARYALRVPRRVELDRISTTNGRISVEGSEGSARLRSTNGTIRVTRVVGTIDIETTNAAVELSGNKGPVTVRTTNGQIRADEVLGMLSANTTNAGINVRLTDPEAGRPISVATTNGSINLTVDALRDNAISASTTNSSITLRVPSNIAARLAATTTNSSVTTDFDINVRGSISKHRIEGEINGGGPPIRLSTTNGGIRVQKI